MLLGLPFADDAFAAPGLGPKQLFSLRIPPGTHELRIAIRPSKAELPLFRKTENTVQGVKVSHQAVTENWLKERSRCLGEITGFEAPVKPYCFRRGHGEALDSSSHISDPQRNLILQHSSSAVFQHNYLSRYITQDTQAAYRGLEPQTALIRAASGMSRSIDPQRPRSMTDDQLANVIRHPEVILARRIRDRWAKHARAQYTTIARSKGTSAHEAYQHAQRAYMRAKRDARKAMVQQVNTRYREEQPVAEILWQLKSRGTRPPERRCKREAEAVLSSERRRVLAALLTFTPSESADCHRQRSEAIDAMTALCNGQDPSVKRVCRGRETCPAGADAKRAICTLAQTTKTDPFPMKCLPTQCIFCMGNEELSQAKRMKAFRNRDGLKGHFERKHLRHHTATQLRCPHPKCGNEEFKHMNHLRNHAASIHGTIT
ncbi:hypothetical protein LTR78_010379 [Recurvomyces mirabilis]|uniref:C2H2-type domain-containing protein n=1 Tax=Recurvomyces mirabilis TaxID=574656 RepID=A0AAE0TS89_9PEZI|nr:hypothetical protein LTR78_010379 [Recurvomyces mirabilis]KAK5150113.1 hypothetical protein LTS14_010376 [Recurvomyces mirabilis]